MNNALKKMIAAGSLWLFSLQATAQANSISLDSCYILARRNYPLVKQYELIAKSREYNLENASRGYLPGIHINGQATYQSDVTSIPVRIPGVDIPGLSKDQYKIYAEIDQPVYDGGMVKAQKKLQEATAALEEQHVAVQLYKLKARVNKLFFGVLLIDGQIKQNELLKKDIRLGLHQANAAIANGAALRSSADVLKAALLKADQHVTELKATRKAYTAMLGLFLHRPLNSHTVFITPPDLISSGEIKRPELQMFRYREQVLNVQNNLLSAENRPRLHFFVQGGLGRPALNFLSNDPEAYYLGGLRLSIPLSGLYTLKNKRALINIKKENLAVQKETFLFNTNFDLRQQHAELQKLEKMLDTDDKIILLRAGIRKTALAQLENGVINNNDYLREVYAEDNARQQKILHRVQLLMAEYRERTTSGN